MSLLIVGCTALSCGGGIKEQRSVQRRIVNKNLGWMELDSIVKGLLSRCRSRAASAPPVAIILSEWDAGECVENVSASDSSGKAAKLR